MSETKPLSLAELQTRIKQGIVAAHPLPYWVAAEIGELKVNGSGHCYLELVEKGDGDALPRARAQAVIWKHHYAMIASYFASATGGALGAGIRVLVKVSVGYHELYGLSLQITDIEPSYTLGELEARRRERIARLQREGVYDMNRELELPAVLQRIAVISSAGAAGYQDFMNELGHNPRGYAYRVTLFGAVMQGAQTEESVIAALDAVAGRMDDFDAVIVLRGGGAQSDLAAFNGYRLTAHLAQFPLPVLTGIGHDKDQSVSDLVAHTALKTPTAAATFLTGHNGRFEALLDDLSEAVIDLAEARLQHARHRLTERAWALSTVSAARTRNADRKLVELHAALRLRATMTLQRRRARLDALKPGEAAGAYLKTQGSRLALLAVRAEAKNPERILRMGYALAVDSEGNIVKSVNDLTVGKILRVRLRDGAVESEIRHIEKKEP